MKYAVSQSDFDQLCRRHRLQNLYPWFDGGPRLHYARFTRFVAAWVYNKNRTER
jgi:hypothetical protein